MHLEITTPDKQVFAGEVEAASFPGTKGAFQVLENHATLVSTLARGVIKYRINNQERSLEIGGGVVEVRSNQVTVLVENLIKQSK